MEYKRVAEYLKTLTEEERTQHRDLILETQSREKDIYQDKIKREKALNGLKESLIRENESFHKLEKTLMGLHLSIKKLDKNREIYEANEIYRVTTSLIEGAVKPIN